MEIIKIREALEALPRARNGKLLRVPDALRFEIIRSAEQFEGRREDFARQAGLSYATIMGWEKKPVMKSSGKGATFRRLEIKPTMSERLFAVDGPRGLKVESLTLTEIAILFKEVSREL
jgi:hypothetical protein